MAISYNSVKHFDVNEIQVASVEYCWIFVIQINYDAAVGDYQW